MLRSTLRHATTAAKLPLNASFVQVRRRWKSIGIPKRPPAWLEPYQLRASTRIETTRIIPSHLLQISHYSQAGPLLVFLSKTFDRWPQDSFPELVTALTVLLKIRHYAGAREVIEAIFERMFSSWNLGPSALNTFLASIFGQDFSDSMSVAATDSVLTYMLDCLRLKHPQDVIDQHTLRLLLLHPQYVSWSNLAKIKAMLCYPHLRPFLGEEGGFGRFTDGTPVVKDHLSIMHSIMQIYSMHGADQGALHWMQLIIKAIPLQEKEPRQISDASGAVLAVLEKASADRADKKRTSFAQMVATTYLASFGRRPGRFVSEPLPTDLELLDEISPAKELDEPTPSTDEVTALARQGPRGVDSSAAMAFFDQLKAASAAEATSGLERILGAPDVFAWTSLLTAASRDRERVPADALLDVLTRLRDDPELPEPDVVTYTVVIAGLNARKEYAKAVHFFRNDFLPEARAGKVELDPQLLQEYVSALTAQGNLQKATGAIGFFAADASASSDTPPSDPLLRSLQLDAHLLNRHMTELARQKHFWSAYNIYRRMESNYSVVPDEVSLSILAKMAISWGACAGRGNVPSNSEDTFGEADRHKPKENQMAKWGSQHSVQGERPADFVMRVFWTMLSQNFPLARQAAETTFVSPARRLFFGAPETPAPLAPKTHALRDPAYHAETLDFPHLYPSPTNMHLFIAVLGYFSASSQIPLALAYMKELSIRPSKKTLCLALWSYEEGGAMTGERTRLLKWLADWLGSKAVPTDQEIGLFRRRQWG